MIRVARAVLRGQKYSLVDHKKPLSSRLLAQQPGGLQYRPAAHEKLLKELGRLQRSLADAQVAGPVQRSRLAYAY